MKIVYWLIILWLSVVQVPMLHATSEAVRITFINPGVSDIKDPSGGVGCQFRHL